MEKGAERERS